MDEREKEKNMSVTLLLHPFIAGERVPSGPVQVKGKTVGECLDVFLQQFPDVEDKLYERPGQLHAYIEVYVNDESAYPDELSRPVRDGDEISLTYLMSGG